MRIDRLSRAPWTAEEVKSLNDYQVARVFHPFTCGRCRDRYDSYQHDYLLTATEEGWVCQTCGYRQDWAWPFMADDSWRDAVPQGWFGRP